MHHHPPDLISTNDNWIFFISSLFILFYICAALYSTYKKGLRRWPLRKIIFWVIGVLTATASIAGPLAQSASVNFKAHMGTHLLLGMLAPLLFVISSPMALLLRTLPVQYSRMLTKIVKSRYVRVISHPVAAAILNIGGLWILYTSDLYYLMHQSMTIYILVHFHVFAAGYLFTSSMVYFDPIPHKFSYAYRTGVFILALAGHGILSKFIYANPPIGVSDTEAEGGAMLMYYGGDLIDALLIIILFSQWYRSTKPKFTIKKDHLSV